MRLDAVVLGLSIRSWLAALLLLSALLVVVGYLRQIAGVGGHFLVWVGFALALLCVCVGAFPTTQKNREVGGNA